MAVLHQDLLSVIVYSRTAINRAADALYQPPPSHHRKGKGGKGRKTYKLNIKTALLIILIMLIMLIIREIM